MRRKDLQISVLPLISEKEFCVDTGDSPINLATLIGLGVIVYVGYKWYKND